MNSVLGLVLTCSLFLCGCSIVLDQVEKQEKRQGKLEFKSGNKRTYCSQPLGQRQLAHSDDTSHREFLQFLGRTTKEGSKLSFIEQLVAWSLLQMNLRPDQVSPTSKLQILVESAPHAQPKYYHFYSSDPKSWPYLYGLDYLLKEGKSNKTLEKIAALIDRYYPDHFLVSDDFEKFLRQNVVGIQSSALLSSFYMRADQTLKKNERIPKLSFAKIVKTFKKTARKHQASLSHSLFNYERKSDVAINCNYDMELYEQSIHMIHEKFVQAHIFGLKLGKSSFIATASQRLTSLSPLSNSILFTGESQARSAAVCHMRSKITGNDLWLTSSDSRDPGQHIFHLIDYGLGPELAPTEIEARLSEARHLFLDNPSRLIFESNRSSDEQLQNLLKLNFPIYNAMKLGNVWSYYRSKKESGFIIDERNPGSLTCLDH